jgi:hypothetical protein
MKFSWKVRDGLIDLGCLHQNMMCVLERLESLERDVRTMKLIPPPTPPQHSLARMDWASDARTIELINKVDNLRKEKDMAVAQWQKSESIIEGFKLAQGLQ